MPVLRFIRSAVGRELDSRDQHGGYRLMARRDPVSVRLITRGGNDGSTLPLVREAVNHLKVRSCLIDGEMVCCGESGCDHQRKVRCLPTFGEPVHEPGQLIHRGTNGEARDG